MAEINTDNIEVGFSSGAAEVEPRKETYNSAYNVYAQDVDLYDEGTVRAREMDDIEKEEKHGFQDIVLTSMEKKEGSSSHDDESDNKETEQDETHMASEEFIDEKLGSLSEEEKKMLQKLRKVVELCTQAEPIKRPTSSEILELLQM